jgi:hypothetical protein
MLGKYPILSTSDSDVLLLDLPIEIPTGKEVTITAMIIAAAIPNFILLSIAMFNMKLFNTASKCAKNEYYTQKRGASFIAEVASSAQTNVDFHFLELFINTIRK